MKTQQEAMVAALAGALLAAPAALQAASAAERFIAAGTLTCNVTTPQSAAIDGRKDVSCRFRGIGRRPRIFTGSLQQTPRSRQLTHQVKWTVLAQGTPGRGSDAPAAITLVGTYQPTSAAPTPWEIPRPRGLVGGWRNQIVLQPRSADSVAELRLTSARPQ